MLTESKFVSRLLRKAAVLTMLISLLVFGVAVAVAQTDLTGVEWQLISMADAATGETTTIPDPSQYTLTFNAGGTVSGQADCNRYAGTYTQDSNGLDINLEMSTMVMCQEDSLEFIFRSALDNAVSGGINSEGNLVLETAGGAQELVFRPGAGAAAAGAAASTGWLGLPWWLWALLALLLLALLWWLFGRKPAPPSTPPPPEPVATRTATPEPPPPPRRDDLTRIEGIGPKIEGILHNAGILTYLGLSETSVERLRDILAAADLRGAFGDPSTWPAQAKLAAEDKWAELEALQESLKGGRVE